MQKSAFSSNPSPTFGYDPLSFSLNIRRVVLFEFSKETNKATVHENKRIGIKKNEC
jgi:hypothetical protein